MPRKADKNRLSDRSMAILWQGKTDMITVDVVHRRHFTNATAEAARSAIRRLCGDPPGSRYLKPELLNETEPYYLLTREGTKLLGISPRYAEPLKKQGKTKRYAVSWFIHADRPGKRTLFNPREFEEELALKERRLPRHPFFIDETTGVARLGMILVDHNAHPRRILHKTISPLVRILRNGWFDEFLVQGSFVVAVLTFNTYRQRAFQHQLPIEITKQLGYGLSRFRTSASNRTPIDVQVHVIPGLDTLVAQSTEGPQR